jgi:hypothetical protein
MIIPFRELPGFSLPAVFVVGRTHVQEPDNCRRGATRHVTLGLWRAEVSHDPELFERTCSAALAAKIAGDD